MNVTYEIRTNRNVTAMSFNDLDLARDRLAHIRKTHGHDWRIVEITRTEREIDS